MVDNLDKILITYKQSNFKVRLQEILISKLGSSHFGPGSENRRKVEKILDDFVRANEDEVGEIVSKYTKEFDGVELTPEQFRIPGKDLEKAYEEVDENLIASVRQAIKNVRKYQEKIFIGNNKDFGKTGIRYTPIRRVGICVPGASAPLPSTVIMCAVPAQVAGVKEIVVISPPRYGGSIHPVTLAVCYELGINEVYRIGGVQAVAAIAFENDTIKVVDKIVGPGNEWVQTAKQLLFGTVGVDSIAGPSEVLVIANDDANPGWIAADMLSQAEHAPGSAVLFTISENLASSVLDKLKEQLGKLKRANESKKCLEKFGGIVVFSSMNEIIDATNNFAPEHLQIQCGDESKKVAEKIRNAGAIFIGDYTPVAVGDYWAGPSHTLPTGRIARFLSALTSNDFVKSISVIEYDKKKLLKDANDIIRLAEAEGLDAHAKSVEIRLK